jgi:hypothetical protein
MALMPGQMSGSFTRFYVRAREGAWIESDEVRSREEAQTEMAKNRWRGRKPCIIEKVVTETVVEEGE